MKTVVYPNLIFLTVLPTQEIYKDRKKFSKAVFEVASSDLVNMGISVVSYTLKDIRDEEVSTVGVMGLPRYDGSGMHLKENQRCAKNPSHDSKESCTRKI